MDEEKLDQLEDEVLLAAKKYAKQYQGILFPLGGVGGLSAIEMSFMRGVEFGLDLKANNAEAKDEQNT